MKVKFHQLFIAGAFTFLLLLVSSAVAQTPFVGITNDATLGTGVYWPVSNADWSLQWTADLGAPLPWQPYPDLPGLTGDGGNLLVNLTAFQATNPQAFFILVSNTVVLPAAPVVVTTAASPVRTTSAFPNGTIQPNTFDTTWWFQWGTDNSYGNITPTNVVDGTNTDPVSVEAGLFGLTPGTVYHFQLYGSNSDGVTSGGDLTFTAATPLPDAIVLTLPATSVTTSSAELSGSINPNGSGSLSRFQWGTDTSYGNNTPTFFPPLQNYDAVIASNSISGLAPNTTYHYRIIGFNGGPDEVFGNDVAFTTSALQQQHGPTVVTLAATSVSSNCVTLNGTVNPNGAATFYYFGYGVLDVNTGSFPGTETTTSSTGSDNSVHNVSITVCGLAPGTEYGCALVAFNSGGGGTAPIVTFTTTGSRAQAPPTVQTLAASSVTSGGAILNGSVDPNGGVTTAFFEYGTTTSYGTITTQTGIGTSPLSDFQAALSGLAPNTTYHFRFDANNIGGGISYGADVTFTTGSAQAPPAVQTLAAGSVRYNQAILNGIANPNGARTHSYFEYGTDTGYGTLTALSDLGSGFFSTSLPYNIGSLLPSTTYHYRITAYNSAGTNHGADVTFTTLAH